MKNKTLKDITENLNLIIIRLVGAREDMLYNEGNNEYNAETINNELDNLIAIRSDLKDIQKHLLDII